MSDTPSSCWITELLHNNLSSTDFCKVIAFLHIDSWASPSAIERIWNEEEKIPDHRFSIEIDIKT